MKKRYICLLVILSVIIIAAVLIFGDFNSYDKSSKAITLDESKIIFTITTFDGKTETKPFVKSLGHSWVEIDNRLSHSIFINDYEIKPGELLTISAWGIEDHFGVAYNVEPAFANKYGRYKERQSISINIDENKLKTIEQYIKDHPKWKFTQNCSYWSLTLWNEIVPDEYKLKTQTILYTPKRVQKSLGEYTCVQIDKDYNNCKNAFIYVDGERTEIDLCG